jgi:hypothetical protein
MNMNAFALVPLYSIVDSDHKRGIADGVPEVQIQRTSQNAMSLLNISPPTHPLAVSR